MAYVINRYDGAAITTVQDGTVDQSLDIAIIGKNYAGYGELQNENAVRMLENFAKDTPPAKAIRGQVWFDTLNKKLKFYTGDQVAGVKVWKSAGGVETGSEPANATQGDMWFDPVTSQLKIRTISNWLVIGPQSAGAGATMMVSRQVKDTNGNLRSILAATINDDVVYIISKDEFVIDSTDPTSTIAGFSTLKKGMTMAFVDPVTGIQTTENIPHVMWGDASNALRLGGALASDYVRSSAGQFSNVAEFSDSGLTIGAGGDLKLYIDPLTGTDAIIEATTGPTITVKVTESGVTKTPLVIGASALLPGENNTYNIGASSGVFANVYASRLVGTADRADALTTPRTIQLTGDITGQVSFDGSANIAIPTTISSSMFSSMFVSVTGGTMSGALDVQSTARVTKLALNPVVNGTSTILVKGDSGILDIGYGTSWSGTSFSSVLTVNPQVSVTSSIPITVGAVSNGSATMIGGTTTTTGALTFKTSDGSVAGTLGTGNITTGKLSIDSNSGYTWAFNKNPLLPGNATAALEAVPKQQLDAMSSTITAAALKVAQDQAVMFAIALG